MNFEEKIFDRNRPDFSELVKYGFVRRNEWYEYEKELSDGLKAFVMVKDTGKVIGRVVDMEIDEEYISFRLPDQTGEYAAKIKAEYEELLTDIREHCFAKQYFHSVQANALTEMIRERHGITPEFLWSEYPDYGVFRNQVTRKWSSIIMQVPKNKITGNSAEMIEVIDIKTDKRTAELLEREGFYSAYHMNRKNWVSIILDDTVDNEVIMELIDSNFRNSPTGGEWIVPANPKYYDVVNAFNRTDTILWKQSSRIKVGDTVYLYVADPYSCIMFRCEAVEVDIPYQFTSREVSMNKVMRVRLLHRYDDDEFTFKVLKEYGVMAIRGPRGVPKELSEALKRAS